MKKIGIGRTAEVFKDGKKVIKLYFEWMSTNQIQYEKYVSTSIYRKYSYIPKVHGTYEKNNRKGIIFEYIEGETFSKYMQKGVKQTIECSKLLGKIHKEIHSITDNNLRSSLSIFERELKKYKEISNNKILKEKVIKFLKENQKKILCHGDFHPENVIIDKNNNTYTIDWINAYYGNPLLDVATTLYLIKHGISPNKKPFIIRFFEMFFRPIIAKFYFKSYFNNNKFLDKHLLKKWQLIFYVKRYNEGLEKEKPFLKKSITKLIKEF